MQRYCPVHSLACHAGAVLDKKPGHIHMTLFRHPMPRSCPVLALGCRIGPVLDEEPGYIHITPSRTRKRSSGA